MIIKELVRAILEHPAGLEWQVQGLGMLRLYLSKTRRLHIWNPKLAYGEDSNIHTHPWDFKSFVICGQLVNVIHRNVPWHDEKTHWRQKIHCGVGGGLVDSPQPCRLVPWNQYRVNPIIGDTILDGYEQKADEIHETRAEPGTVTIIERSFREDTEHAYVFWPYNKTWKSAEPRRATSLEIFQTTGLALEKLNADLSR